MGKCSVSKNHKSTDMKKSIIWGLALMGVLTFSACSSDKDEPQSSADKLSKEVLHDVAYNIIIPTYNNLVSKTNDLSLKIEALKKSPSQQNLDAAREAWRAARRPWEQSEAFLFGPTGDRGIDPALDSWPVDVPAMNAVLAGNKPITAESLAANDDARGFHLVEYLLWGENGNKTVTAFTSREYEYLTAAAKDIKANADKLVEYWTPYAKQLADAGEEGNLKYPSFNAAFQELVAGMIDISNEVGNEKIENPLNGEDTDEAHKDNRPHPDLEESRFSHNSKSDYTDNIQSVKNVYEGMLNNASYKGLSDIIKAMAKEQKNENLGNLDREIIKQIDVAQKAIMAIPGTFTDAIQTERPAVKKAQTEVGKLNELLQKLNEEAFHAAPPK